MQMKVTLAIMTRCMALLLVLVLGNACALLPSDNYRDALEHYENKEYSGALPVLQRLAKRGDARAMVLLAQMYQFGEGVLPAPKTAYDLLTKAANQGNAQAQYLIGGYYLGGKGFEIDFAKAFEWNMKAASQGHMLAQMTVGQAFLNGIGVTKDICAAREWLEKSALQGNVTAKNLLVEATDVICLDSRLKK